MGLKDAPGNWLADLGCGLGCFAFIVTFVALVCIPIWKAITR